MNVYIYAADIWCEACGEAIKERLIAEGKAPENPNDEHTYDSGDFPKGPDSDGGGSADCPQHCGANGDCLNAEVLSNGMKVGAFLRNPLTSDGYDYLLEQCRDQNGNKEVLAIWRDYYGSDRHDGKSINEHLDGSEDEDDE